MATLRSTKHEDTRWDAIVNLSEDLLKAVREERWDDLELQAQYRDKLIREYFAAPITVANALRVREEISSILAIDEQILGCARREQEKTSGILKTFRTGSKAIQSYQTNTA